MTYLPVLLIARNRTFMGDPADAHPRWRRTLIRAHRMDLVYRVLDKQLVDVDGRRCGRVDDLEFDGGLGEPPQLHAISAAPVHGIGAFRVRCAASERAYSAPA